jgi:hypothetical protein
LDLVKQLVLNAAISWTSGTSCQDAIEHHPTTGYHEFNVQKKTTSLNREELSFPIFNLYTIFETSFHNKHSKKEANKKETLYQELFS